MPPRLVGAEVFILTNGMRMGPVCLRQMLIILGRVGEYVRDLGPPMPGESGVCLLKHSLSPCCIPGTIQVLSKRDLASVLIGIV